jgi:hypothetical protein
MRTRDEHTDEAGVENGPRPTDPRLLRRAVLSARRWPLRPCSAYCLSSIWLIVLPIAGIVLGLVLGFTAPFGRHHRRPAPRRAAGTGGRRTTSDALLPPRRPRVRHTTATTPVNPTTTAAAVKRSSSSAAPAVERAATTTSPASATSVTATPFADWIGSARPDGIPGRHRRPRRGGREIAGVGIWIDRGTACRARREPLLQRRAQRRRTLPASRRLDRRGRTEATRRGWHRPSCRRRPRHVRFATCAMSATA